MGSPTETSHAFGKALKSRLGYWPNSYRLIQLAHESLKTPFQRAYWEDEALDKDGWR